MVILGTRRKSFTEAGTFLHYQSKVIHDPARVIVWEKSRRIGATWSVAYRALRRGALNATPHAPKSWFTSADDTAALEYIDYVQFWARQVQVKAQLIPEALFDSEQSITSRAVYLSNGYEIHALTSSARQLRSKGGDAIWDEAAWHDNPIQMYRAIMALRIWGGSLLILSTHNGLNSIFNRLVGDAKVKKGWSHHRTTIHDALNQGMLAKIDGKTPTKKRIAEFLKELRDDCLDEDNWKQEFLCEPVDEALAFLTYALIDGMEREGVLVDDLRTCRGPLYLGMDIGRHKHPSVLMILEELERLLFLRKMIVMEKKSFKEQRQVLWPLLLMPNMRRAAIDATGMGEEIAEDAVRDFPSKVEAVKFTAPRKDSLAHGLYREAEDKTLWIPKGDLDLREDLHSVRKVVTAAGNTRFDVMAPQRHGHADRFWALALAREAAHAPDNRPADAASAGLSADEVLDRPFGKDISQGFQDLGSGGRWHGAF